MVQVCGLVEGAFTATGESDFTRRSGKFNISISIPGIGSVELQRSFDDGATWETVTDDAGNKREYTTTVSTYATESEPSVYYKLLCTAISGGDITYRIGNGYVC